MKRTFATLIFATLSISAFAGDGWLTSYKEAAALSKKTGKPILADFTGSDWCYWCKKLHDEVYSKPEFKAWAKKNVVLLYLDFPQSKQLPAPLQKQNDGLAKKYKIDGFPTALFLKHDGTKLGQMGYMAGGPVKWTQAASKTVKGLKA